MIFITVGTQKFSFNRLIKEVDTLVSEKKIGEKVFAQIGYSSYVPLAIQYKRFLTNEEFNHTLDEASIVITHGGTSSIIKAIKKEKKVIAVPRLAKFHEHVDDHQTEITSLFHDEGYVRELKNINLLSEEVNSIRDWEPKIFTSSNQMMIELILDYIKKT